MRGIYVNSTLTSSTITGNTISNLNNAYSGNIASRTDAICTSGGSNTIQNNIVSYLTANSSAVLLKGIQQVVTTTGTDQVVTGNTVHDLSNTSSTGSAVIAGIQYSGPITLSNKVSFNFVHGLSLASSNTNSEIDGIVLGGRL
ncbi:MAG: hypothetical protein IPP72_16365 [Chitinophagaceae bacterium]|nr:hypothetical protein [Chitinophagaceae bacterium]